MAKLTRLIEVVDFDIDSLKSLDGDPPPLELVGVSTYGRTLGQRYGELTADQLGNGLTLKVPALTGHPLLPMEGAIYVAMAFFKDGEEGVNWQFGSNIFNGVYEGEELRFTWDDIKDQVGSVMLSAYAVFDSDGKMAIAGGAASWLDLAPPTLMPKVMGAGESVIPWSVANRGTVLHVPAYHGMKVGDEVTLYLLGAQPSGSGVFRESIEHHHIGQGVDVLLPAQKLRSNANRTVIFFYTVSREEGTLAGPIVDFDVEGEYGLFVLSNAVHYPERGSVVLHDVYAAVLTLPLSAGQEAGDLQSLLFWPQESYTRRDYLLVTQEASDQSKLSLPYIPGPYGGVVYANGWLEKPSGDTYVSALTPIFVSRPLLSRPLANTVQSMPAEAPSAASLVAPTVLEAIDGAVSDAALDQGLTVQAPRPPGAADGAFVQLLLKGYTLLTTTHAFVSSSPILEWQVTGSSAGLLRNNVVSVSYLVMDGSGAESFPTVLDFAVTHRAVQLLETQLIAPPLPTLRLADAQRGASLFLPMTQSQALGDVLTLFWGGTGAQGHWVSTIPLEQSHLDEGLLLAIDPDSLTPHAGGEIVISYTMLSLGIESPGPSSRFRVEGFIEEVVMAPAATYTPPLYHFKPPLDLYWPAVPALAVGDQIVCYVQSESGAAIAMESWQGTYTVSSVGEPVALGIPDELFNRNKPIEVRFFVVSKVSGKVSYISRFFGSERSGYSGWEQFRHFPPAMG